MKKNLYRVLALLLTAVLLFALVGCSAIINSKPFARGTVNGNVYHSDFSGLTVTLPDGWFVYSDEQMISDYGMDPDYLNNPSRIEDSEDEFYDFYAADDDETIDFAISYIKGSVLDSVDDTLKALAEEMEKTFEESDIDCTIVGYESRTLSGKSFKRAELYLEGFGDNITEYVYLAKEGAYFYCIDIGDYYSVGPEVIEAMFS